MRGHQHPHEMPVPPLPDQNGRTPVPVPTRDRTIRDACFAEWSFAETSARLISSDIARDAFAAGWEARANYNPK